MRDKQNCLLEQTNERVIALVAALERGVSGEVLQQFNVVVGDVDVINTQIHVSKELTNTVNELLYVLPSPCRELNSNLRFTIPVHYHCATGADMNT